MVIICQRCFLIIYPLDSNKLLSDAYELRLESKVERKVNLVPKRRIKKVAINHQARSRTVKPGFTCIDLFSGAGGFAEGLRQAGWSVLSGNDIDADAGETFRLNFPEASFFEGPISKLKPEELLKDAGLAAGELDCLVGGPPCQSFSYNNHQRSATNARAKLFRDYLRIVEALQPKTLVMENVPGMLTIGNGRIVKAIEKELGKLNYACSIRMIYAEDFGTPQARRRVFVVASRIGTLENIFPAGTHGPSPKPSSGIAIKFVHSWKNPLGTKSNPLVTVWDAISDLPQLRNGGGAHSSEYTKEPSSDYQRMMRKEAVTLYNHTCHNLSEMMLERIKCVPEGGNWTDIPRELLTAGMRRAHLNCHTKRYGRLDRKGLASTMLTKCDPHWGAYIHPTQSRTLSVREAARLQGFPDNFQFAGSSINNHYVQIGNAVPVPIAKALGLSLSEHIEEFSLNQSRRLKAAA
jgi:DNA (cytosine-5)-methyltransferase 1